MKRIILSLLRFAARQVLDRYQPEIIGVTGSVGKTSAKRAIAAVLGARMRVRASEKSYNTEIGLPLAIMDVKSSGRSVVGWFRAAANVFWELVTHDPDYPDILVLEMGADHPGDIAKLVRIASPRVGVVTAITPAHTEFLGSLEAVAREKGTLVRSLPESGIAVLSRDDPRVFILRTETRARVVTFGLHEEADVRGSEIRTTLSAGTSFTLFHAGSAVPVSLPRAVGIPSVLSALAAAAVGIAHDMNLVEIAESLRAFSPPPSRLSVLSGIKGTTIIDDSYNSSPAALTAALRVSADAPISGRKIAVLGDMLELGAESRDEHRRAGELVARSGTALLIGVGARAVDLLAGARDAGMSKDHIFHFATAREAGKFLQNTIQPGDLLLVKGSQGVRLERVVVELMAEPLRAPELVCRNDPEWLARL